MNLRAKFFFSMLGAVCFLFAICCPPRANAGTMCAAGNFSTVAGTTCDIGSLQFTFGSVTGETYSYTNTGSEVYYYTYGNSDLTFAPAVNGFTISVTGGPNATAGGTQSVTAPTNGYATDYANLYFTVTDTTGNLTGMSATQTQTLTGSNYSYVELFGDQQNSSGTGYMEPSMQTTDNYGTLSSSSSENSLYGLPFSVGTYGYGYAVDSNAFDGNNVTTGPSTFTFTTTPDASTILLLGINLLGAVLLGLGWKVYTSRASATHATPVV
jgi:hypothetical protein